MTVDLTTTERKPRIAIMGEFSAGKSTLCNLLMRSRALPERVTATRLAPVWMTKGPCEDIRMTIDGREEPVNIDRLDEVPFQDTLYIRLGLSADILEHCDFIDFPGISDPNMDAEVWERVLVEADAVIWLTHATQAWRQSEAAVWDTVPEHVRQKSILLATRFDKIVAEADQVRVMNRLNKEAGPHFAKVFPISLTEAIAAQSDFDAWEQCGAAAMMDHLAGLISELATGTAASAPEAKESQNAPVHTQTAKAAETPASAPAPTVEVKPVGPTKQVAPEQPRIMPRRIRPNGDKRTPRPQALRA